MTAELIAAAWARWTMSHPRLIVVVICLLTLGFGYGLTRIEFGTRLEDFQRRETRELLRTIETGFEQGHVLAVTFVSKDENSSLLEPRLLQQQLRFLRAVKSRFPVDTLSLVDAIDKGVRRARGKSLLEVTDYTTVAQGILALSGGRTVRDLEKISRNFLSHPEAIGFYTRLRLASSAFPGWVPLQQGSRDGAQQTRFRPPPLQAMRALIQFAGTMDAGERRRVSIQIREFAHSFIDDDLDILLMSSDLVAAEIDEQTGRNLLLMGLAVMSVAVVVFWLMFMRGCEVLIPVVLMATSMVWTFGAAGLMGVQLSFIHLMVLPILFGTGNDDALIFGRQLLAERKAGHKFSPAIEKTFAKTGKAISLTTLTTFVGFGVSSWLADSEGVKSFAFLVALSMLFIFVLTVSLQGPLRLWRDRDASIGAGESTLREKARDRFVACSQAIGDLSFRLLVKNRKAVLLAFSLISLAALVGTMGLDTEFSKRIFLRPDMQTARAEAAQEKYFGIADSAYILLEGQVENPALVEKLQQLERRLFDYPRVQKVLREIYVDSVTELIEKLFIHLSPRSNMREIFERLSTSRQTADFVLDETFQEAAAKRVRKQDGRYDALLMRFVVTGGDGVKIRSFLDQLRNEMKALGLYGYDNVKVRVGGGSIAYYLDEAFFFDKFIKGGFLTLALNFLVLVTLWRNWTFSVLALVPLLVSLAITLGTMVLLGVKLNVLNLSIGAIVVGVGIDYPIHIIERFSQETARGAGASLEAMRRTLQSVGSAVWAGALTTLVGFAACTILAMPVAVSFGLLMALAIACVYLASMFLLPALLVNIRLHAEPGTRYPLAPRL